MDISSEGGEFLLSSPSYRIEKAQLRYENLLLSLDDDSIDNAERKIIDTDESVGSLHLDNSFDEKYSTYSTSQLESKQGQETSINPIEFHKSPVTNIYKSVTRRYVIAENSDDDPSSTKRSRRKAPSRQPPSLPSAHGAKDFIRDPKVEWSDQSEAKQSKMDHGTTLRTSTAIHQNDDIVIAQQSEIEMLKYELSELKMKSSQEIVTLTAAKESLQNSLSSEKEAYLEELTSCKRELAETKAALKSTRDELESDKTNLNKALQKIDRITRRGQALYRPVEKSSISPIVIPRTRHKSHYRAEH
mmetsp:Transcript_11443/g.18654  ORF Transcript_11443/g.18654 Transcript_11443/m.18654 type:complete len:302 (-) Transcript_11443:767-1672(-)